MFKILKGKFKELNLISPKGVERINKHKKRERKKEAFIILIT